ncbi:MAG: VTT domain-containing protein [Cyanobacteria bacterium P01_H01_bin.121]
MFGRQTGLLLSLIASVLGCSANYWISRKLGRRVVSRLLGESSLEELDEFTQSLKGHHSIFYMMILMPLSQDIVSYAVGLTKIRYSTFLIALVSSGFAIVAAYIYLGTSLLEAIVN